MAEEALAMEEGRTKYGAFNYRVKGVKSRVYIAALLRHVFKWLSGEERDEKTGVHHLGSARACLGIILDAEACNKLIDDRPPAVRSVSILLDRMEERVRKVREVFKGHDPVHYTIVREIEHGKEARDDAKAEGGEVAAKPHSPREDGEPVPGRDGGQLVLWPEG